jgi:hypothetical protein
MSRSRDLANQLVDEGWRDLAAAGLIGLSALAAPGAETTTPNRPAIHKTMTQHRDDFFKKLHRVEANKRMHPPKGDGGRAMGPFQIWYDYWADAVKFDPSIGGSYEDVENYDYAKKIVSAYLRHYAPKAWREGDWTTLARVHNGGPTGNKKLATAAYASRYKKAKM